MSANGIRHRDKYKNGKAISSGVVKHEEHKKYEEFVTRESPLTLLLENSPHIRAIYHIFVVILVLLFLDTVIYDLIESGKINIGLSVVVNSFGDIKRGVKLWLFDFAVVLGFYPALIIYSFIGKLSRKYPGLRPLTNGIGIAGLVATEVAVTVPAWDLGRKHLAVASSLAVTLEMFRFMMKLVSVAVAVGPRCLTGNLPLPSFKHYLYFMFAPTLLYRDQYPRTKRTRWGYVFFKMFEIAANVFYITFLWERFISPYWSDYGKQKTVAAGTVVRGIFACVLPGIIAYFCGFYCLLHAWMNAWSEVLTFGDRLFYEDWWTSSCFSRYFRCWNLVVHSWLRDHIYLPTASRFGRGVATAIVFMVSSVAHEVVLALSFGFFYPVLFIQFGVTGALLVPITANCGKRFPNSLNILLWMGLFIGNGILWSLYPMEYFASKNCPSSENDSYFIPKSWTCPEIIFHPDWTFQNPFRI